MITTKNYNKCGSDKTIKMGKMQASGGLKQKYYCKGCMHFFYPQYTRTERMAHIIEKLDY
jgi:transposase-like protein